jgi:Flp pilus assembly protein TadG
MPFPYAFPTSRFLTRLARQQAGNVLITWAIAIIPLIGIIGSGVDVGRGYLAKAQLQNACDAAALAGRRAMSSGSVDATVRSEATKLFNFNFPQGSYGTAAFTPAVTSAADSAQTVVVTASSTINTTIMKIFGFRTLPIAVTCNAKQDFVNTDIVLVLDTTGSMKDKATSSDSQTKIQALRSAVLALYDQLADVQTQLEAGGLRLRYGIVPYASTVNMGAAIMSANAGYVYSGLTPYQSRQVVTDGTGKSACSKLNGSYSSSGSGSCTYFQYLQRDIDTMDYVAGKSVNIAPTIGTDDSTGMTPTTTKANNVSWAGCTEERDTIRMASTATTIPSTAYDLDIDLIPSSKATKWKAYWPDVEYASYKIGIYSGDPYKPQYACPTAARRMAAWNRSDLNTYLNSLNPDGGTYHDFGMMWGARLASAGGIFGGDNPDTYNSMPVKKYIIFMTDGLFDTGYSTLYSGYGVEQLDARVTPGGSSSNENDQLARHKNRFSLLCSKAKTMGYSVWVIGFATTLDTALTNCATNAGQASTSANSAALLAKFVEIGKDIGALRLTQ